MATTLTKSDANYLIGELLTLANARGDLAHACDRARQVSDNFPGQTDQPAEYTMGVYRTPDPEIVMTLYGPGGEQKVRITVEPIEE